MIEKMGDHKGSPLQYSKIADEVKFMQTDVAEKIVEKVKVLSEDQQEKVLKFVENLEPPRKTLWEKHLQDIPEEELDKIPTDASVNLDHYLYGAPKK
jgi:hypothetical protein